MPADVSPEPGSFGGNNERSTQTGTAVPKSWDLITKIGRISPAERPPTSNKVTDVGSTQFSTDLRHVSTAGGIRVSTSHAASPVSCLHSPSTTPPAGEDTKASERQQAGARLGDDGDDRERHVVVRAAAIAIGRVADLEGGAVRRESAALRGRIGKAAGYGIGAIVQDDDEGVVHVGRVSAEERDLHVARQGDRARDVQLAIGRPRRVGAGGPAQFEGKMRPGNKGCVAGFQKTRARAGTRQDRAAAGDIDRPGGGAGAAESAGAIDGCGSGNWAADQQCTGVHRGPARIVIRIGQSGGARSILHHAEGIGDEISDGQGIAAIEDEGGSCSKARDRGTAGERAGGAAIADLHGRRGNTRLAQVGIAAREDDRSPLRDAQGARTTDRTADDQGIAALKLQGPVVGGGSGAKGTDSTPGTSNDERGARIDRRRARVGIVREEEIRPGTGLDDVDGPTDRNGKGCSATAIELQRTGRRARDPAGIHDCAGGTAVIAQLQDAAVDRRHAGIAAVSRQDQRTRTDLRQIAAGAKDRAGIGGRRVIIAHGKSGAAHLHLARAGERTDRLAIRTRCDPSLRVDRIQGQDPGTGDRDSAGGRQRIGRCGVEETVIDDGGALIGIRAGQGGIVDSVLGDTTRATHCPTDHDVVRPRGETIGGRNVMRTRGQLEIGGNRRRWEGAWGVRAGERNVATQRDGAFGHGRVDHAGSRRRVAIAEAEVADRRASAVDVERATGDDDIVSRRNRARAVQLQRTECHGGGPRIAVW